MSKEKIDRIIGETLAYRVYALPWVLELTEDWKYKDLLALEHTITEVVFIDPNFTETKKHRFVTKDIGTKRHTFDVANRGGEQIYNTPLFKISTSIDFDYIYPVMHETFPKLVHPGQLQGNPKRIKAKNLKIVKLTTINDKSQVLIWKRLDVGVKTKVFKLALMSIDGIDTADIPQNIQIKAAGKLFENVCEISRVFTPKPACKLAY